MRLPLIFAAVAAAFLASCSEPEAQPEPVAGPNTKLLSVNPPTHWKVIMDKSGFPISMCVFQIPNSADVGGRESTNVITAAYAARSTQAQDSLASTRGRFVKTNLRTSQQGGWEVESYSEIQGTTRYRILDGTRVQSDKTLFVRIAWPSLPGNAPGYDAEMQRSFDRLLPQVK